MSKLTKEELGKALEAAAKIVSKSGGMPDHVIIAVTEENEKIFPGLRALYDSLPDPVTND